MPMVESYKKGVRSARRNGYSVEPGNVWVRIDEIESLDSGNEINIRLSTPRNPYMLRKKVKGRWKFHLYPTNELGMGLKQEYELLLCENVDKLPYDFMAIDPKAHDMVGIGDRRNIPYPLGPDSKLAVFVLEPQGEFLQYAVTMPDWEDDIRNHISNAEAVNQIFRGDFWVLQHIWSKKVMVTWNVIFGFHGGVISK